MKRLRKYTIEELQPYGVLPDGVPAIFPPFGEFEEWKVQNAFRYVSKEGWKVMVPADFLTDLASVPRFLRAFYGVNQRESVGAVVHDWGYRNAEKKVINIFTKETRTLTRREWDVIFYDLMALGRTKWERRESMYLGVRIGGWAHDSWRGPK